MPNTIVRRLATVGAMVALAVGTVALTAPAAQAAPATTSVVTAAPAGQDLGATALPAKPEPRHINGYWSFVGAFPDPVTCAIAGATTGRQFYCAFYFFFWGLNVWTP
jgi:hypothetical protein